MLSNTANFILLFFILYSHICRKVDDLCIYII